MAIDESEASREGGATPEETMRCYRGLLEQAVEGVWVADLETHEIVDVNSAFCELVGYDRQELLGRPIDGFIDRSSEELRLYLKRLKKDGGLPPVEGHWRNRDGETIQVQITSRLIRTPERRLVCTMGRDIREKKRLEAQLELTDRLASIGTLASGIAHELNNPLSYILTNLHVLREEIDELIESGERPDYEEWKQVLAQSRRGVDRMKRIVDDLRSFYRTGDHRLELLKVQNILEAVKGLAMSELSEDADIVEEHEPAPPIEANRSALEQAFLNILINAVQALPEQSHEHDERHQITIRSGETTQGGAWVEIADTGVGIPPEELERIFDPFYTTKPVDEGTGLGLSMAHSIIHSFGGEIWVDSEVGEGSRFRIELPAPGASEISADSITPFP